MQFFLKNPAPTTNIFLLPKANRKKNTRLLGRWVLTPKNKNEENYQAWLELQEFSNQFKTGLLIVCSFPGRHQQTSLATFISSAFMLGNFDFLTITSTIPISEEIEGSTTRSLLSLDKDYIESNVKPPFRSVVAWNLTKEAWNNSDLGSQHTRRLEYLRQRIDRENRKPFAKKKPR